MTAGADHMMHVWSILCARIWFKWSHRTETGMNTLPQRVMQDSGG